MNKTKQSDDHQYQKTAREFIADSLAGHHAKFGKNARDRFGRRIVGMDEVEKNLDRFVRRWW